MMNAESYGSGRTRANGVRPGICQARFEAVQLNLASQPEFQACD